MGKVPRKGQTANTLRHTVFVTITQIYHSMNTATYEQIDLRAILFLKSGAGLFAEPQTKVKEKVFSETVLNTWVRDRSLFQLDSLSRCSLRQSDITVPCLTRLLRFLEARDVFF